MTIFSIISDFDWELIIEEQEVSELLKKTHLLKEKRRKKHLFIKQTYWREGSTLSVPASFY